MRASKFLKAQFKRAINTYGVLYTFHRKKLDDFNEPNGEKFAKSIPGIFHMSTAYKSLTTSDSATLPSKNTPSILVRFEDAKDLIPGDIVFIEGVRYHITGLTDVSRWGIVTDISLEMEITGDNERGALKDAFG